MQAFLQAKRDLLRLTPAGICLAACLSLAFSGCEKNEPTDEAKAAGKTTADFPQITADIFKPMDGGINLSPEEIMVAIPGTSGAQAISIFGIAQPRTAMG